MRYKGTKMAHLASRVPLQQGPRIEISVEPILTAPTFSFPFSISFLFVLFFLVQKVNAQEAAARDLLESNGFRGWVGKNTYSREPGT